MNLNMDNCWGIISGLINLCLEQCQADGKLSWQPAEVACVVRWWERGAHTAGIGRCPAAAACCFLHACTANRIPTDAPQPPRRVLLYPARQGGADSRAQTHQPGAPLLWRCGPLVAAPVRRAQLAQSSLRLSALHCFHTGTKPCPAALPILPPPTHLSLLPSPPTHPPPTTYHTGKYLLVRDPNKPQLTLYRIPAEDAAHYAGEGGEQAAAGEGEGDDE